MPSLPELRNIPAQEGVTKVFFHAESKNSGNSDCNIRISGEIKVHLHGIDDNAVPETECCLINQGIAQELFYNRCQIICQNDLFAKADCDSAKAFTDVIGGNVAAVQVLLHGGIPGDWAGNCNREERNVEQEGEEILFRMYLSPGAINQIGHKPEGEKADAQRQR